MNQFDSPLKTAQAEIAEGPDTTSTETTSSESGDVNQ